MHNCFEYCIDVIQYEKRTFVLSLHSRIPKLDESRMTLFFIGYQKTVFLYLRYMDKRELGQLIAKNFYVPMKLQGALLILGFVLLTECDVEDMSKIRGALIQAVRDKKPNAL